jgi:hypothetical protein
MANLVSTQWLRETQLTFPFQILGLMNPKIHLETPPKAVTLRDQAQG